MYFAGLSPSELFLRGLIGQSPIILDCSQHLQSQGGFLARACEVDMNPSKYHKSKMESSSKIVKHMYVPPGTLARGRRQSFRALGSVRVNAEQRGDTLFSHEEEETWDTRRSEIRLFEFEKVKKLRGTNWCKNVAELKVGENVAPPSFDQTFEGDTLFPHEEEEMQGTQRSEISILLSQAIRLFRCYCIRTIFIFDLNWNLHGFVVTPRSITSMLCSTVIYYDDVTICSSILR
ncbi:uncharacterized protein [Nicotiana sylvestris]|uniref:Uncharacterized protein LOC104229875 isoform X1 n=2 Tax=Nicotiana sylvestris TaxID=4096 RepID=A0A1U7X346_NICSY|nr:PREDICTED: uncharacterized protein LOC104229875 isoform X1 [Nicotiana sylvestris]